MNEIFRLHIESLHNSFENLLNCEPFSFDAIPKILPTSGIYLFTENGKHLYTGRTNGIRTRLKQHCRPGSTHNSAPFAFRLARESCNILKATYKKEGSRASLIENPEFSTAFNSAKSRLRTMQIRVVEESNPLRQALLEMYVHISLETPYNDFNNH